MFEPGKLCKTQVAQGKSTKIVVQNVLEMNRMLKIEFWLFTSLSLSYFFFQKKGEGGKR